MNMKGHSVTLVQGHSDSTFWSFFSIETARPIETKFYVTPPWDWGMKIYSNGPFPIWSLCPFMVKNLKNLPRNRKADDLEIWHAALGTQVLQSLFKWCILTFMSTFMNIKGQGHSDSTFSNFFSSKNTRPIEAKFHIKPPWTIGWVTWPKWLPGPYMVKTFHNLLRN